MSQREEHEKYLLKAILSRSITSANPSQKTKKEALKKSDSYFEMLKQNLIEEYDGKTFRDIDGSKVVNNDSGETLEVKNSEKFNFNIEENNFKEELNHNLKLVSKIGPKTELTLKNQGYDTISSLQSHDKYGDSARAIINNFENMSFSEILRLLNKNKYTKKCRDNLLKCISLTDCENFRFMDIETLGFSNVPIILIGVAEVKKDKIVSYQYLLRDYYEEPAVLESYLSHLDESSIQVTFNGKLFDVPFIKNRCNYHRIDFNKDNPNLDLLYFARNLWGDKLPNCKLQTIEKYLFNIERQDDVPGQYISNYYNSYIERENIGPLVPIIEHNRQDIISLASFLMRMYEEVNNEGI